VSDVIKKCLFVFTEHRLHSASTLYTNVCRWRLYA